MKGAVFDTKKHSNIKRKAEYRRIGKYHKSLEKFKAEKARRKRILELHDKGVTIKGIAQQLQVSERTVKRDLGRMKSYINGQSKRFIRQTEQETIDYFNSLSLKKQIEYVVRLKRIKRKIRKPRSCRALVITVDVDKAFGGRYQAVKFKPNLPVEMLDNGRITLQLMAQGRTQPIARIYVGRIVSRSLNLQTNDSMNQFIEPTLKGLKVVTSTACGGSEN